MKLTRNEICILINYYEDLKFDLEDRMEKFKNVHVELMDNDLFITQRERYESRHDEFESRINELQTELDELY
jgi:hypothetical protein